jgi:hypothetical protein
MAVGDRRRGDACTACTASAASIGLGVARELAVAVVTLRAADVGLESDGRVDSNRELLIPRCVDAIGAAFLATVVALAGADRAADDGRATSLVVSLATGRAG